MHKFTASILATAALAGGTLSGVALASSGSPHPGKTEISSIDKSNQKHDSSRDASKHDSSSKESTRADTNDR
jgi:hypothetical protein